MKDDPNLDESGSTDEENEENHGVKDKYRVKFQDLILFLRRVHRDIYYQAAYQTRKSQGTSQVAAAIVEDVSHEDQDHESLNVAAIQPEKGKKNYPKRNTGGPKTPSARKPAQKTSWRCPFCDEQVNFHPIENCEEYKKLPRGEKIKGIRKYGRCLNCLRANHISKDCTRQRCSVCKEAHHVSLHPTDVETS